MKNYQLFLGFTLVELLVTLAIAAILVTVGAPSFTTLISSNSAKNASDRLSNSLAYARSEAVTRGANVTVCSKSAGGDTCANGTSWINGWLIYVEDAFAAGAAGATNVNGEANADDLLLRSEDISELNLDPVGIATADSVVYGSLGNTPAATVISFVGSNGDTSSGKDVSVSPLGTVTVTNGAHELYKPEESEEDSK